MKNSYRHVWLAGILVVVVSTGASGAAVFDMDVVKINGGFMFPAKEITVVPGDNFEVRFSFKGWAPDGLIGYQARILAESLESGECGKLELHEVSCTDDDDCFGEAACQLDDVCECLAAVYVDTSVRDWVFTDPVPPYSPNGFGSGDCESAAALEGGYKVGGVTINIGQGQADLGINYYAGTLILQVPDSGINGDFLIEINPSPNSTNARKVGSLAVDVDASATLLVHVNGECDPGGDCPEGAVTFVDPVDGAFDARQPHAVNSATPLLGYDTFEVTAPVGALESCWTLCETDNNPSVHLGLAANDIAGVVDNGGGSYTITLDRAITHGEVTTLTYTSDLAATTTGTFRYMPADVNDDGTSAPADILSLIDSLNGVTPRPAEQTDADRDGTPAPADILRVIDLLNGAGEFEPFLNVTLDETGCP